MAATVLLTGGSGMVGRNLLEHPNAKDWHVISPSSAEVDLLEAKCVEDFVASCEPSLIIHCAGRVGGIQANIENPIDFLVQNVDIGRNVIMAAHKAGVRKLLNLGSSCMYPRNIDGLLTEDMVLSGPLEPTNEGYALAKVFAARLCDYVSRSHPHLSYKTLIPSNLYGKYDKFNAESSHLVPAIIHKVHHAKINRLDEVEIWGDGTARREFLYAGDLADAIWRAVSDFDQISDYTNIGLSNDYSINDYYSMVAEVIGWSGTFVHNLSKPVGMRRKRVDTTKQRLWGWEPKHTIEQGLNLTYNYYLSEVA